MLRPEQSKKPIPRTGSKLLLAVSRILSFVLHPLFMTTIAAFILYKLVYEFIPANFFVISSNRFKKWLGELAMITILLPLLIIPVLKLSNLITSVRMHQARDRILPLIGTLIFYVYAYWAFTEKYNAPLLLRVLILGSCSAVLLIIPINLYYKVSVHMTGAGILTGMCLVLLLQVRQDVLVPLFCAITLGLLIAAIRWVMGAHTVGQLVLGYLLGILMQLAAYFYLKPS